MNYKSINKYTAIAIALTAAISLYAVCIGGKPALDSAVFGVGDRGGDVWLIQKRLGEMGYYTGEESGVFDRETAEAVRKFQRDEGLDADGKVGPAELQALGIYGSNTQYAMKLGSVGSDVLRLQRALRRLGYYSGALTGSFGSRTAEAVRNFRRDHGLPVSGEADAALLAAIGLSDAEHSAPYDSGMGYRLDLLARLVETLAQNEPYSAQTAVAAAALNRESELGGGVPLRTVVKVMLSEYGENTALVTSASDRAVSAARDAMFGIDPTSGASHFGRTPDGSEAVKLGGIWFY